MSFGPIVLTGGGGMVGRNVRALAEKRGVQVLAPLRAELDLLDGPAVAAYLGRTRPGLVIHAAGRVGGIQANMREQAAQMVENWTIGQNVVLGARDAGVPRLINLGSSCMYPRTMNILREEDVLTGALEPTNEGYAIAKCAVARLCDFVGRETPGIAYKTVIPSNLYGPFDKFDPAWSHLVPAIIHKVHRAKVERRGAVDIWGDGTARRDFLYGGDLADALLAGAERFDTMPSVMNVGVGIDHTVNEYYEAAAEVIGYRGTFVHDLAKPVGVRQKLTDVSRAKAWGWQAKTSLRDGLAATYAYYLTTPFAEAPYPT